MAKKYDLEERTFKFSREILDLIDDIPKTLANVELAKQVIRSGGSVGANYIEANEALSRKDFIYRIKLCRKEAKETTYWLKLLDCQNDLTQEGNEIIQESIEITKIFGAIYRNISE